MGGYNDFAFYYDSLTGNISYKQRAEYFDMLIKKHNGKKNILLDLACGTGSLSEEMSRLGYDVIAVDSSEEMLNVAIEKKFESGLPIQYLRQDMTELDMFGTIDVTICALDSLNHLPDIVSFEKTVRRVSLFCEPDGLFIFDVNTPYKHKNVLGSNTFVYDLDNVYCVWQNSYHEENNKVDIWLDFFEHTDDDKYIRYQEDFSEIALEEKMIDEILVSSGFEIAAKYDYDTTDSVKSCSEKIVYVARKIK